MAPAILPVADPNLAQFLKPMMADWMWRKRLESVPSRLRIQQWATLVNFIEPQPSLIALYGSWGRGHRRTTDDVDMVVVVDWPFSPRPEPATVAGDAGMLCGRRKLVMAHALPPPISKLYWDFFLSSDLLVLTSSEVETWRGLDDWLGDEVRSAFAPGESRIIFQDGQLQGWRDYPFKNNPEPLETTLADCSPQQIAALVAWLDDPTLPPPGTAEQRQAFAANPLAWAKPWGEAYLQRAIKAQKHAPAHDGTEADQGPTVVSS
jgi:hypothetical protein